MPTLMLIPTGIGCSVGGYAGDAIPSARLLAAASGCLITHPNVMNGALLYWSDPSIQYVEGYALDRFAAGHLLLQPVRKQTIGLLLDSGIERDLYQRQLQVVDSCKATLGLSIGPIVKTDRPLNIRLENGPSGMSWGNVGNPDVLIKAGAKLKELGATAIAVVPRFPDDIDSETFESYRLGEGADPLAGAEAVISRLLGRYLSVPCAHAPALRPLPLDPDLDPRAAAEDLGYTFLPSVLVGLSRAPNLISISESNRYMKFSQDSFIYPTELGAIVAPQGALGGEAVLACLEKGVPLVVVENPNILNVTSQLLGIESILSKKNAEAIFYAKNYLEAAGIVLSLREGVCMESINRPIGKVSEDSP